jgi:hypothetical protein
MSIPEVYIAISLYIWAILSYGSDSFAEIVLDIAPFSTSIVLLKTEHCPTSNYLCLCPTS